MSPLWPERLVAVLDARGASLARRRVWRGGVQENGSAACAAPGWPAAADALATLLAERERRRGELTVVLSSQFVRFRLVPWSEAIGSPDELEAYARACFEEVYGSAGGGWALRLSPEPAGRARIVAGIERALLERLQAIAADAGLRLASVQPYLMAAFNRLAGKFRHGDFLFVLAEPERSTLVTARNGSWAGVSSSAGSDSDDALAALIAREAELQSAAGQALPAVYVHAPRRADCAPRPGNGVAPVTLAAPAAPGADPRAAMAMVAG